MRFKTSFDSLRLLWLGFGVLVGAASLLPAETLPLSELDLATFQLTSGSPQKNKSAFQKPLTIAGQTFETGVGTLSESRFTIDPGDSERFTASVGLNDAEKPGSVEFHVIADGKEIWTSGVMKTGQPAQKVDLPIKGVRQLMLKVTDGGDGRDNDLADWADAKFEYTSVKPKPYQAPLSEAVILTPKPGPAPRINGPSVFGVRPGSPFLYSIPVTGDRPVAYSVEGLPNGLSLDAATGRITGVLKAKGDYPVKLHAKNAIGTAGKKFRIVVGDTIALTPPMGWNSWNCWATAVDQKKVLQSARAMVSSGLVNHGWTYINIDDTWQGKRGGPLNAIQPNEKFPDMKGLCDEVHALGLKAGIYSTPWITSYAHCVGGSAENPEGTWPPSKEPFDKKKQWIIGSYTFADKDAQQWAQWGIDYLKYDWNPNEVRETEEMAKALLQSGRDIVYSLSNSTPFKNIAELSKLANCWRTTGDITDTWGSIRGCGLKKDQWAPFQSPGHFNDPDMLVVGQVGWGNTHPSRLTADEQYTHISLWALLGAPLLIGCDLSALDEFTLGLLTNDEVLEADQDPLCRQATVMATNGDTQVLAKQLEDGSWAVGLFNLGFEPQTITVNWAALKIEGAHRVRDLWRQKDIGSFPEKFSAEVASHGVVFVRVF